MSTKTMPARKSKFKEGLNPVVFIGSSLVIFGIVLLTLLLHDKSEAFFIHLKSSMVQYASWFYILIVAVILIAVIFLGVTRYGRIKLGPDHSVPEFKNFSWFAMLFSAGMGIGLMFYGVAEPLTHYINPPNIPGQTREAAKLALNITLFHWGLHAWAIYAIVALILAFFSFRHNLPLSMRSALYPIIGDRIYGWIGDVVDIFAIVATMFGVATSLGIGVGQISAGIVYLFPFLDGSILANNSFLIIAITGLATLSVASGLDKGIKILSNLNMSMAVILMVFVLFCGSTLYLLSTMVQNVGTYFSAIIQKSFNIYAYYPDSVSGTDISPQEWIGNWTINYWAWWLSWSPFVGMFIARVSKGRTIREFILGVLLVPTGFTIIWMTVFGDGAIHMVAQDNFQPLADVINNGKISIALYTFLQNIPLSAITIPISMLMVALFFITSADSGAMVIDTIANNGANRTPAWSRIYWAVSVGIIAMVLMFAGGLKALSAMTIISALPFSIILILSMYGLFKVLGVELRKQEALEFNSYIPQATHKDWRNRLQTIVAYPSENKVRRFISKSVKPALEKVADEMQEISALKVTVEDLDDGVQAVVHHGQEQDFYYKVKINELQSPSFDESNNETYAGAEVHLKEGGQGYDIMGWSEEAIINDVLNQYDKHLLFLHSIRS